MFDGNGESSASTSISWNTAQSSIVAKINPVTTFVVLFKGMYQFYGEPDQSKGPLQSDLVENIASHLNERGFPSFL